MKIRQIEAAERQEFSIPVQAYAFQPRWRGAAGM